MTHEKKRTGPPAGGGPKGPRPRIVQAPRTAPPTVSQPLSKQPAPGGGFKKREKARALFVPAPRTAPPTAPQRPFEDNAALRYSMEQQGNTFADWWRRFTDTLRGK